MGGETRHEKEIRALPSVATVGRWLSWVRFCASGIESFSQFFLDFGGTLSSDATGAGNEAPQAGERQVMP